MEATMHEAKTSLSKLVARARAGEEIILTNGKSRIPVARIVAIKEIPVLKERPIGMFASEMGPDSDYDWSEPLSDEELALWEAPIVSTWLDNSLLENKIGETAPRHPHTPLVHEQQQAIKPERALRNLAIGK